MVNGIDNAFDHMAFCLSYQQKNYFSVFQEILSVTEFPGSSFLLPTIQTGSKWDFQVANLLLATVNFKPYK